MQTTANNLIKAAFGLVGLLNGDGSLTPAADALRPNALACLNTVIAELTGYNESSTGEPITPKSVNTPEDTVKCGDYFANSAIPIGLARRLAAGFDMELAAFYRGEYYECLKMLRAFGKSVAKPIEEVYS